MHPKSISRGLLKRTKIALALPSYDRQRLSGIRRGWCPLRPKTGLGAPFRRWRCSPPVVKCAPCIRPTLSSQGETEARKRLWRLQNLGLRQHCCKAAGATKSKPSQLLKASSFPVAGRCALLDRLGVGSGYQDTLKPPSLAHSKATGGTVACLADRAGADSRPAAGLRFGSRAIFRGRYRPAHPPWHGVRTIADP